jgi:hypothetical protein
MLLRFENWPCLRLQENRIPKNNYSNLGLRVAGWKDRTEQFFFVSFSPEDGNRANFRNVKVLVYSEDDQNPK